MKTISTQISEQTLLNTVAVQHVQNDELQTIAGEGTPVVKF